MSRKIILKAILNFMLLISIASKVTQAQVKKKTATTSKQKDIDVLYQKYKDRDTVTVSNANGIAKLGVSIDFNDVGKPKSIKLTGYVYSSELANSIIEKLANDKLRAGYRYSNFSTEFSDKTVSVSVYTKGSQYAKYGTDEFGKEMVEKMLNGIFIYLEVGDVSRSLKKSSEFTF